MNLQVIIVAFIFLNVALPNKPKRCWIFLIYSISSNNIKEYINQDVFDISVIQVDCFQIMDLAWNETRQIVIFLHVIYVALYRHGCYDNLNSQERFVAV